MNAVLIVLGVLFGVALVSAAIDLYLIALILRRIADALESGALTGRPGLPGPAGPQGEAGPRGKDAQLPPHLMLQAAPATSSHGMARVMRQEGSEWVAGQWVRENTPAWQRAWDTPGIALMPAAGEMQLGKQE